ncbi:MAG: hypothetical protein GX610_10770 [Rhodococcus sp.]|nr:hypothetical protein [Rhodococcus sp. (in: high G+C Gram-positive bacteria)]
MKLARGVGVAAVVVCALTACGSGEDSDDARSAAASSVNAAMDDAKSAVFVAAYRGAFAGLAEGRSDDDITSVLQETCVDLESSAEPQDVQDEIKSRSENNGTEPTDNQARQIYEMAKVACP